MGDKADSGGSQSQTKSVKPYIWGHSCDSGELTEKQKQAQTATRSEPRGVLNKVKFAIDDNWGFLRKLKRSKRTNEKVYTISDFEPMVYDCRHHNTTTGLLMEDEIIAIRNESSANAITPGVWRCFRDGRVYVADCLMLVSVILTGVLTPITFIWGGTWGDDQVPGSPGLLIVDMILDFGFAMYLLMRLNVSFLHSKQRLEICERSKILQKWLTDPMYWIGWLSTTCYIWVGATGIPLVVNNIKLVRVINLIWIPDSCWRLQDKSYLLVLRPTFLLSLSAHWVACILACVGGYRETIERQGGAGMFSTNIDKWSAPDRFSAYLMALVESTYMLTGAMDNPLGDGGPRSHNFGNLLLVATVGPLGIVIISLVISNVVRASSLANALEIKHEENKAFIARALENLDIPQDLQRRVFSMHYFQRYTHDFEAFEELFKKKNLSSPLESALRIYLYHESFLNSGYFKDKDTNYTLEVVRCLEDCVFVPGDYVIRRGEKGGEMFFVGRGELTVHIPHHKAEFRHDLFKAFVGAEISKGAYFGEIALVADCLRTAWVCAESYVILSELRRQAIEGIWKYFPAERQILIETITNNTIRNRKDAMQRLWRHVAKRGVKELGPAGEADDETEQGPLADLPHKSVATSAPGSINRTAAEELEARFRYAQESNDLLSGIKETTRFAPLPIMKTNSSTDDTTAIDVGSVMRHFDRCCHQLLRGQDKTNETVQKLSKTIEDVSSRQKALSKRAGLMAKVDSKGTPYRPEPMSSPKSPRRDNGSPADPKSSPRRDNGSPRRDNAPPKTPMKLKIQFSDTNNWSEAIHRASLQSNGVDVQISNPSSNVSSLIAPFSNQTSLASMQSGQQSGGFRGRGAKKNVASGNPVASTLVEASSAVALTKVPGQAPPTSFPVAKNLANQRDVDDAHTPNKQAQQKSSNVLEPPGSPRNVADQAAGSPRNVADQAAATSTAETNKTASAPDSQKKYKRNFKNRPNAKLGDKLDKETRTVSGLQTAADSRSPSFLAKNDGVAALSF